jgi:hypothetical protein
MTTTTNQERDAEMDVTLDQMKRTAVALWKLLDDIDTLDDACRHDDEMFRAAAYRRQRQRFEHLSGEDFDALRKEMATQDTDIATKSSTNQEHGEG